MRLHQGNPASTKCAPHHTVEPYLMPHWCPYVERCSHCVAMGSALILRHCPMMAPRAISPKSPGLHTACKEAVMLWAKPVSYEDCACPCDCQASSRVPARSLLHGVHALAEGDAAHAAALCAELALQAQSDLVGLAGQPGQAPAAGLRQRPQWPGQHVGGGQTPGEAGRRKGLIPHRSGAVPAQLLRLPSAQTTSPVRRRAGHTVVWLCHAVLAKDDDACWI